MVRKFLVIAALIAAPASAQTTRCQWVGDVWTCDTDNTRNRAQEALDRALAESARIQERNQETFSNIINDAIRQQQERRQANQFQMQAEAQSWSQRIRLQIGERIARGDCKGAQQLAVQNGQTDLAFQAKKYCTSLPPK